MSDNPNFMSFDNTDDLIKFFEEQRRMAESIRTAPWQQALKPGDFVVVDRTSDFGLVIYGEIIDLVSPGEPELPTYLVGGRFYSDQCPEGELGTHHRAQVTLKVNPDLWAIIKNNHWPNDQLYVLAIASLQRDRQTRQN